MAKNQKEVEKQSLKGLKDEHKLLIDDSALKYSLAVLRLAVFASSLQSGLLVPNYPFLASIGAHPVSFTLRKILFFFSNKN